MLGDTVKGRAEPCHIVYVALFLKLSAFTEVRLDVHPIRLDITVSLTKARTRRPGAAASVSRRRRERRNLLAGGGRRASCSHTLAASQAFERLHLRKAMG